MNRIMSTNTCHLFMPHMHAHHVTQALMENKELLDTAIQVSSDIHINKLLGNEERMGKRAVEMCKGQITHYKVGEQKRVW